MKVKAILEPQYPDPSAAEVPLLRRSCIENRQ
jgi:hypothetical protein